MLPEFPKGKHPQNLPKWAQNYIKELQTRLWAAECALDAWRKGEIIRKKK